MIERLIVVQSDDLFSVVEPITSTIISTSVSKEFACDWSLGFLEALKFIATGKRADFIEHDYPVAFLLGQMAAQTAWETSRKDIKVNESSRESGSIQQQ